MILAPGGVERVNVDVHQPVADGLVDGRKADGDVLAADGDAGRRTAAARRPAPSFISWLIGVVGFAEPHLAPSAGERRVDLLRPVLRPSLARLADLAESSLEHLAEMAPVDGVLDRVPVADGCGAVCALRDQLRQPLQRVFEVRLDARDRPVGDAPERIISVLVVARDAYDRVAVRVVLAGVPSPVHGLDAFQEKLPLPTRPAARDQRVLLQPLAIVQDDALDGVCLDGFHAATSTRCRAILAITSGTHAVCASLPANTGCIFTTRPSWSAWPPSSLQIAASNSPRKPWWP